MTEIKRYDLCYDQMMQEPQGEWVRWEDIQEWLEANSPERLEEVFFEASKQRGWQTPRMCADYKVPGYRGAETHWVGQQPEGAVLIPGTERLGPTDE